MPFEKSVLVPLNADETFALITQPDRLRRWQVITARVDLRAGGEYRWTVIPGNSAAGTFTEVEPGRRVVFTWGWEGPRRSDCRRRVDRDHHAGARRGRDHGHLARGAVRRAGGQPRRGLDALPRPASPRPPPGRRARRVGGQA